ncbi:YpdA family putative bacillithiol disulfide reductase [Chitinophaga ginsengisegetis]|uniref:YpdA family putative bacillithiol disulfide reductase n=1 Tax=Chitinophaga ginsengisegetis TaxID=393003 RepID=UPI000DB9A09C|nr:YpdA family putative bacillithiol disulfide reductase [Chitinophaga ginsengisegetis]MDR6569741.1 thioredoxin reductase (NADPH) [Chitinophaga ginsengisegetis]MDR6649474.1 thioredoxin reductase (NADPH) [Chitinophaga ginsengisegetis]MDR6655824.1 thioredoxin reductase (NADPH) [Chitinophaga ginsengisegetis]
MTAAFDVLIIGGGPIGLACGLEAKRAGLSYIILEKGCVVNSLYNYPLYMTFFSTSERLEIGNVPFVSINPKPTRPEALEYYRRVATSHELNIKLFEEVEQVTPNAGEYTITTRKSVYHARHVVIATGFYDIPNLLNIPGEDLPKVTHYYKDPHFYATQDVVVIGAHNSAVDAALETYRKGARVTMVIRQEDIGSRVKYWVRPDIENRIKEGSVKAWFNSSLTAIRDKEVDIATPDGPVTIANDFVIAMTGYQPNFSLLQKSGIALSDDKLKLPAYNPVTMETNMPRIYLAGVVCGGMNTHVWFIENSRDHAEKIMKHIKTNA